MMKKLVILMFLIGIMAFSALVSAQLIVDAATLNEKLAGNTLPPGIGKFFNGEKVNLYIQMNAGQTVILGITAADNKIQSIQQGELEGSALKIYASEEVITAILTSNDPGLALGKAFQENKLSYKGVGFKNKMKFAFLGTLARVSGWFKGEAEEKEEKKNESVEKKEEKAEAKEEKKEQKAEEKKKEEVKETLNATIVTNTSTTTNTTPLTATNTSTNTTITTNATNTTVVETGPKTYSVNIEAAGYKPSPLTIKVGDTVVWKVMRSGTLHLAMVIGTQKCGKIKSKIMNTGDTYSWTFTEAEKGTCVIADGITTTQASKIIVEDKNK